MKNLTFDEIIKKESDLWYSAEKTFGEYFKNAFDANLLLQNFLVEVSPKATLFMIFLAQIRNHHTLSLFSSVRLHKIQSLINLRYTLEAGADAAYALANPTLIKDFVIEEDGILDCPQSLRKARYKWLQKEYPQFSDWNKNQKNNLNNNIAHSNIIYAYNSFDLLKDEKKQNVFECKYFDKFDDFQIKTDLWLISDVVIGILTVFEVINKGFPSLILKDNFVKELKRIEEANNKLKAEMMQSDRYKKIKVIHK